VIDHRKRQAPIPRPGPLALVGGGEWRPGCDFDSELLAASGSHEVLVLPTAAAYEHPERTVETAARWFEKLGGKVSGLMVLRRPDAIDEANVTALREARFVYLAGGSPMHLRSVLKDTPLWEALVSVWQQGAVVAASSAAAMVLGDPMIDPRGGAFTVGLALISQLAFVPHHDTWEPHKARRTIELAPAGIPVVAVDERTAVIREPDGTWRVAGAGRSVVFVDRVEVGLSALSKVAID
jgi:cyanophycinase